MQKLDKSKLNMSFAKKERLVPYLEKAFLDFDEPWEFKYEPKQGDDAWHPSGDCTPTPSELWEKTQNFYVEDTSPVFAVSGSLRKSFMVGHYWHQLLQYIVLNKLEFCTPEAIERKGKVVWKESGRAAITEAGLSGVWVPSPFHWACGSGDIAPLELPKGWKGVVDFKTMRSGSFLAKGVPFADKYECQINIYMDFFDEEKALILGVNKDSPHSFKEFEYVRNQPLIDEIYSKWKYVSECLDNDTLPVDSEFGPLPLAGHVVV